MDKNKKIANNILEFLLDPTVFPVKSRNYFRPEEILKNESYEGAKADSERAYGDQSHNSDFYPKRSLLQREASMERKTLIASLDVLSQNFQESDPIAKDLRTMAYAVSKMSDEEFTSRMSSAYTDFVGKFISKYKKEHPDEKIEVSKIMPEAAKAWKAQKKADEDSTEKESSEEVTEHNDFWSKEASEVVQKALISEICEEKQAGKIKGPGIPDGTGPRSETGECPLTKEKKSEKKKAAEVAEEKAVEEKISEEEEAEKKETEACKEKEIKEEESAKSAEVDTNLLATENFDGIQIQAGMLSTEDIGDLTEEEETRLGQLFS